MRPAEPTPFESWAVVELLGHRRMIGRVTEQQIAGAGFLRVDIPDREGGFAQTHIVNPSAVYAITPVSEEAARLVDRANSPHPITVWELPRDVLDAMNGVGRASIEKDGVPY